VEFFSFFFILFGGVESLDQMASVPGLPPAIQELVELFGASLDSFGGEALFSWAPPRCQRYLLGDFKEW
jgi:hypothetical protein